MILYPSSASMLEARSEISASSSTSRINSRFPFSFRILISAGASLLAAATSFGWGDAFFAPRFESSFGGSSAATPGGGKTEKDGGKDGLRVDVARVAAPVRIAEVTRSKSAWAVLL